jgi:hypothetical protein
MKKLFTLLVGVMLGGSAFGQTKWTTIFDQDLENNFDDQNMEFFECSERHGANRGPVRIVEDPADPTNHCIKVIVRSDAEATEEGDRSTEGYGNDVHLISWDTQFFIYFKEIIPEGKEIRLTMNVKGEKDGSMQFQTHAYPQAYIHYQLFPNADDGGNTLSYTTEWAAKPYVKQDVVGASAAKNSDGLQFQCIAFNMTHSPYEGNVVYLDNIKVQIRDQKQETGEISWINFMRKGVFSDDPIDEVNYGSDEEPNMVKVSNFMIQVRDPETGGNVLQQAPIVETGDAQFPNAVKVPTLNHYSETVQIPDLDADGNEQKDPETGEVLMKDSTTYYWADGSVIGTSAPARYSSQFFVSTLHKMKAGEKYKFVFWVKADKPASIATQAHTLPTKYKDYNTFKWKDGDSEKNEFPVTTEWTKYELGEPAGQTVPSGAGGCQTITFDTYILQEENNYYFVFEECSFSEANVTIADRTLGTPEDLALPVNEGEEEQPTQIDLAPMLKTFELEDVSFLTNPKSGDGMKLLMLLEPEDEGDVPVETFSGILSWSDGGFINGDGYYIDDENGINLAFSEESLDGTKINLNVWNNPDSGISFADGKTVKTKLALSNAGWYYIYNITLGTAESLAGISPVKAEKAGNGMIYNLSGQRVDASYKGLVIKNGQKMIQK